jgi:hypothetical protein
MPPLLVDELFDEELELLVEELLEEDVELLEELLELLDDEVELLLELELLDVLEVVDELLLELELLEVFPSLSPSSPVPPHAVKNVPIITAVLTLRVLRHARCKNGDIIITPKLSGTCKVNWELGTELHNKK